MKEILKFVPNIAEELKTLYTLLKEEKESTAKLQLEEEILGTINQICYLADADALKVIPANVDEAIDILNNIYTSRTTNTDLELDTEIKLPNLVLDNGDINFSVLESSTKGQIALQKELEDALGEEPLHKISMLVDMYIKNTVVPAFESKMSQALESLGNRFTKEIETASFLNNLQSADTQSEIVSLKDLAMATTDEMTELREKPAISKLTKEDIMPLLVSDEVQSEVETYRLNKARLEEDHQQLEVLVGGLGIYSLPYTKSEDFAELGGDGNMLTTKKVSNHTKYLTIDNCTPEERIEITKKYGQDLQKSDPYWSNLLESKEDKQLIELALDNVKNRLKATIDNRLKIIDTKNPEDATNYNISTLLDELNTSCKNVTDTHLTSLMLPTPRISGTGLAKAINTIINCHQEAPQEADPIQDYKQYISSISQPTAPAIKEALPPASPFPQQPAPKELTFQAPEPVVIENYSPYDF